MSNPNLHSSADASTDPSVVATAARAADSGAAGADPGPAPDPMESGAGRAPRKGWLESLQSIWRELPGLVSDRVDLLSLELQRAGRVLAQIVALLVAAAILGVTAWLALWAGIAVGLVELGLHWSLSLLLVLALNAGVAWLAISRLRTLLPLLRLPATRRHLTPGRTTEPSAPSGPPAPPAPDTNAAATAPLGQAG